MPVRFDVSHLSYILSLLHRHRRRVAIAVAAMTLLTALGLVQPLIIAVLIDTVVGQQRYEWLAPLMMVYLAMPFMEGMLRLISDWFVTLLSQRLLFDVRLDMYRKVHRMHMRQMQAMPAGKLMERLRGDVQQVQMLITGQTLSLGVQLLCALVALVIMGGISLRLTSLVLLAIWLYVANYKWLVRRIRAKHRRFRRKADMISAFCQERMSGIAVVKAFGRQRSEFRRQTRLNFMLEDVCSEFRMRNNHYLITSSLIAWGCNLSVLGCGVYFAIKGELTYGQVVAVGAYTWRLLNPAVQLAELSNQIQQCKVAMGRIFELLRAESDAVAKPGLKLPTLSGEVTFENVCFQYDPGKPVLKHVNFYVKPGQMVALVGHTGCGKTTITSLLYRFFEPQAGHLCIDGHDISTLDTHWYRRHLALVPQDPVVFDTTIAANIAYGRPQASDGEIENAARLAELGSLLDRLPEGIHTRLGEYGIKLSLGEKQRLCIARAILADPVILILDEATSSLDSHSEAMIQRALKRVMANRTSFVVAHRLSTIRHADLIVVMDHGQVIEMGTHDQLMQRTDGHYRHLFLTQQGLAQEKHVA